MNSDRIDLENGDFTFPEHESLARLKGSVSALKAATPFAKPAMAEKTLDAALDVLIEQRAEIENLTNCVSFLQKTMENQAHAN